jgi:hypothetical protein
MMTSRRAFLSALAAFLIGVVMLPEFAAAQVQVPDPVPRPKVVPNPKAALPIAPTATTTTTPPPPTKAAEPIDAGDFTHGRVIVLRGLANVFSRGMDKLAKDLGRSACRSPSRTIRNGRRSPPS